MSKDPTLGGRLILPDEIERNLYDKDGNKYDLKHDPNDVTGLMQGDEQLRLQMIQQGFVVFWAIDGKYRLTDKGRREMERRRDLMQRSRMQGDVQPFPERSKHVYAIQQNAQPLESEEDQIKRDIKRGSLVYKNEQERKHDND